MDKVYKGCMLVDEHELDIMLHTMFQYLKGFEHDNEYYQSIVKLYAKVLKEKEDIQHEREKHESKTEGI
jgi:hypothetical protein